jgi:PAS domain S-box-containing protein
MPLATQKSSCWKKWPTICRLVLRTLRTRAAFNASHAELRKLSLVVEQSPNSIVITNLEPRIEYVNDAFTRNTGFARDEVLGKNPGLLKSGKTPVATYQDMWQTLLDAKTWVGEFINHSRSGQGADRGSHHHAADPERWPGLTLRCHQGRHHGQAAAGRPVAQAVPGGGAKP